MLVTQRIVILEFLRTRRETHFSTWQLLFTPKFDQIVGCSVQVDQLGCSRLRIILIKPALLQAASQNDLGYSDSSLQTLRWLCSWIDSSQQNAVLASMKKLLFYQIIAFGCFSASTLIADSADVPATFDRWNYPFNTSPGSRLSGSTFGAIGNPQFDDHDAQIVLGFNLAELGISSTIDVTSLEVRLTTSTDNAFELDSTYDPVSSYLDPASDTDAGRPVELYGVGFRNGFFFPAFGPSIPGPVAFEEAEAFVFGNPAAESVRNAFMTDNVRTTEGGLRDVSNNVAEGFENQPWAVGDVVGLADGMPVPLQSVMTFDLDLSNPTVLSYIESGVESGGLFFSVASLHSSTQGSSAGIPSFFLGDPNLPDLDLAVAELSIDYEVVPEPGSGSYLLVGVIVLAASRRRIGRVSAS